MNGRTEKIHIARAFSRFPAGRFLSDGPATGERFREEFLMPALARSEAVEVYLDGVLGYGSSFLEEAFGGLVRLHGFSETELRRRLSFVAYDDTLTNEIWGYISRAKAAPQHATA